MERTEERMTELVNQYSLLLANANKNTSATAQNLLKVQELTKETRQELLDNKKRQTEIK
jgi:hypothetical protein